MFKYRPLLVVVRKLIGGYDTLSTRNNIGG